MDLGLYKFNKSSIYVLNVYVRFTANFIYLFVETLPDALQSNCSKCTEQQKKGSAKAIMHLQTRKPADWKKLTDKYDPQGNYLKNQKLAAGKN